MIQSKICSNAKKVENESLKTMHTRNNLQFLLKYIFVIDSFNIPKKISNT